MLALKIHCFGAINVTTKNKFRLGKVIALRRISNYGYITAPL